MESMSFVQSVRLYCYINMFDKNGNIVNVLTTVWFSGVMK